MRTLAVVVFIAGVAALAVGLARTRTVADGRVMEAEFLALFSPRGVTRIACDQEIPIGRHGAVFACTATLGDGANQLLDCTIDRSGKLTATPVGAPRLPTGKRPAGEPRLGADPSPADPDLAAEPSPDPDPDPSSESSPAAGPRRAVAPGHDEIRTSRDPWSN